MHGKIIAALFACLALPFMAGAEASAAKPYAIGSVSFAIEGRTAESALRRSLEAEGPFVGAAFATKAELEALVAERRQALANNRVFASVEASVEYAERAGGVSEAAVAFAVRDTNNIVVLPEPKYDSNAGLSLTLKGRDYNFLGSMRSLELDLGYTSENLNDTAYHSFNGETNFVLPFRALGQDLSFGLYEDAALWTAGTAKSATAASLGWAPSGLGFPASVKAIGGIHYNDDLPASGSDPLRDVDPLFLSTSALAKATIPLGLSISALGEVRLEPRLSFTESWWPGTALSYPKRDGASAQAEASLKAGRIDWQGNFQDGAALEARLIGTEYFGLADFVGEARASYEGHWAFGATEGAEGGLAWGLAARASALGRPLGAFPGDELQDLGSYLRGVVDARIDARYGAFLNLSAPVKLFDFPTHAIIGKDILDFELQAAPFVDAAYIAGSADGSGDGPWASAGLELAVFPKAFRSFIVRASFGYDLVRGDGAGSFGPYEIYIGTGLFLDPAKTTYEEWVEK